MPTVFSEPLYTTLTIHPLCIHPFLTGYPQCVTPIPKSTLSINHRVISVSNTLGDTTDGPLNAATKHDTLRQAV